MVGQGSHSLPRRARLTVKEFSRISEEASLPIAAVNSRAGRAAQPSIADTINVLRHHYPDALVCVECGRLLATRPKSYENSDLSEPSRLSYVCAGCRSDTDPARSAEVTARFASSRATAASSRLRPPLRGLTLCSCTERVMCASCLQTRAAEAAEGLRVADDYLDGCATNGHHHDPDELFDCIHASATIADSILAPTFCEHGRSAENCIVHARPAPGSAMPAALARCESCGGWHGKSGGERCPYSRDEAKAIKAACEQPDRHENLPQKAETGLPATSGQGRADASCNSLNSYGLSEGVSVTVGSLLIRSGAFFRTTRRGGRPRGGLSFRQQQRERSRRYRQRRARAQETDTV